MKQEVANTRWWSRWLPATKADLDKMEGRLIQAIQGGSAGELAQLTNELKASADPLNAAIAAQSGDPNKK